MKKHIWIVIAIVLVFLGLIIAYSQMPPDHNPGDATSPAEKSTQ